MPICRQAIQLTYCYQWNSSSVCLEKEEVPGAKVTAIKLLAKPRKQVVPSAASHPLAACFPSFSSHCLIFSSWFMLLPFLLSVPAPFRVYLLGMRGGHLLHFSKTLSSWARSTDVRAMGLILRTCSSFYLFKFSQGRGRREDFVAASDELQSLPHPSLTSWGLIFHSPLSLTSLPLCKSFLGFTLKGQRNWKGGAAELKKSPLQTTEIPAFQGSRAPASGWGGLPQGPSWGSLTQGRGSCRFKAVLEVPALIIIFSRSRSTGNCSEGKIIALKGETWMWYIWAYSKHNI